MAEHKAAKAAAKVAAAEIKEVLAEAAPAVAETVTETAPVETKPVETEVEAPTTAETEKVVDPPAKVEEHRSKGAEKRINELVKAREEARAEAAYLRGILEGKGIKPETQEPQVAYPTLDPNKPVAPQIEAIIERREKDREVARKMKEAYTKYPDLKDLEAEVERIEYPDITLDAIKDSDLTGDIYHHLMANPDEARELAKMPPAKAIKEIGRMEERLSAKTKAAPAKVTLNPPPPLQSVKSNTALSTVKVHKYTSY